MKIVMIYDQIQSGKGIKDDHMVPLGLVKEYCMLFILWRWIL